MCQVRCCRFLRFQALNCSLPLCSSGELRTCRTRDLLGLVRHTPCNAESGTPTPKPGFKSSGLGSQQRHALSLQKLHALEDSRKSPQESQSLAASRGATKPQKKPQGEGLSMSGLHVVRWIWFLCIFLAEAQNLTIEMFPSPLRIFFRRSNVGCLH